MYTEKVTLEFSHAEALVLFEIVSRYTEEGKFEIIDIAEQRVLWDICTMLEQILTDPFKPNYSELLEKAREQVRDGSVSG